MSLMVHYVNILLAPSIHRQTLTLLTFVLEESEGDPKLTTEAEDLSMTCRSNMAACHFQARL